MLEALEKSRFGGRTAVVFVGDNGWHLGEKEHWGKVTLWGESASVPLIWSVPGVYKEPDDASKGSIS